MQQLHGSGKTAVLVERIINKVIEEKIDIDKILVVTFTNAAASEMKQRVLDAIYKKIEQMPEDMHLKRQINLLNKANICTIHSFCLDVIRNNFYIIDASANFKVADTAQIELLKQEVLEDLFEEKYVNKEENFIKLVNTYTSYRGDEPLKELILNVYNYIQSTPFPEKWLNNKVKMFNIKDINQDFKKTIWGNILIQEFIEELEQNRLKLNVIKQNLDKYEELEKYSNTISFDIEKIDELIKLSKNASWDEIYTKTNELQFEKWPIDKKVSLDYKNTAKQERDIIKKNINKVIEKIMISNSKEANESIYSMYEMLNNIKDVVIEFSNKFANAKKEKNIIDFSDIEHFALKILVENKEDKAYRTEIAKKYMEKFSEIAIDEYQDSNLVQEYILKSISNGKNMFMVGDVKQSIYKFRQAMPELFLEKYDNWLLFENKEDLEENNTENLDSLDKGKKIKLFKNFRSRKNILDITNLVFTNIMSKSLGDIDYNEEEYLNLGANYPENDSLSRNNLKTELHIIDLKDKENEEQDEENEQEEEKKEEENTKIIENAQIEAKFVANKIKELIDIGYMVYDKNEGYRKITYKDIVILLRATSVLSPIYEKELSTLNFPVFSDTTQEYLDSMEIGTIMALLKIIDNPLDDISLITILRSPIGNFTDNDLVEIRLSDKIEKSFYNTLIKARMSTTEELKNKIDIFLERLKAWKNLEKYKPLDELIWQIYDDTNYYNYVGLLQNGALRQANLKMLFERAKQYESSSFKGLFNFIKFIDKLRISSNDMSAAKIIGENENVIRIMSIHKSKGLEFPVVFLCGTGKRFNLQDLNEEIIMHQDLGFGPKYINSLRGIEYTTLAKEALKIKIKRETISEELRVLYVALTRAKEKLIITGLSKDLEKSLKEKEELLKAGEKEELLKAGEKEEKIDLGILKKYNSYLDFLELVYLNNKDKISDIMELKEHQYKDINFEEQEEIQKIDVLKKVNAVKEDGKNKEKIKSILEWKYKYIEAFDIPTKTSVTKIKELENKEKFDFIESLKNGSIRISDEEQEIKYEKELKVPNFMKESEEELSYAKKGTLMHLCIQKLDEKKDYTLEDIDNLVKNLNEKQIITEKEAKSIDIKRLYEYTKSNLFNELKYAKKVYKEEPFYINVDASKIYKNKELEEKILVQGIIDLFYIDKEDKLILVDYKTDYIEKGKENTLIEKYKVQLNLYKEALEKALNRKVDKVLIYSVYLQKEIEI